MISRKLSIALVLMVLLSFAQAKNECPLECDCSDNLSVVRCRGMDKFPVFDFASKVKTLDVTYGNIKHIYYKDVKAYINLENLFISHNPLDCDHATTFTLKHVLKKTIKLKSFDGHKIKCQQMVPLLPKEEHGHGHHIHVHHAGAHHFSPLLVAGAIAITILGVLSLVGACLLLLHYRRKLFGASEWDEAEDGSQDGSEYSSDGEELVSRMEEGDADTSAQALREGLRKKRKQSQGFPKNALVDSETEEVVEKEDYMKGKMKKQRRLSQGYAEGSGSSEDEPVMVEINLNGF